jgi:uncharacterized membrane protein
MAESVKKLRHPEYRNSLLARLRQYFITGTATVFPIFITLYVVIVLFSFLDSLIGQALNDILSRFFGFQIPGLGIIIAVAVILLTGFLSRNWIGKWMFQYLEHLFERAPVFTNIYPSAKQLSDFLFNENTRRKFKEAVMVEYPEKGSYSLGFITNDGLRSLDKAAGENLISVFVPFAPVPFSGLILLLTADKVKQVDYTVDQAIKFVVSGGIVAPVHSSGTHSQSDTQERGKERGGDDR